VVHIPPIPEPGGTLQLVVSAAFLALVQSRKAARAILLPSASGA
jgi:hypothetical protein